MNEVLNRLTTSQTLELVNRYGLKARYKNPQKRRMALIRCLRAYWLSNHVEDCAICLEQNTFAHMVITPCAHLFCDTCLLPYIINKESCPMCRAHCCYIGVISQLSTERFIKVRNIIQSYKPAVIINVPDNPSLNINQPYSFISSSFGVIVFLVNVFTIYMTATVILCYIYNLPFVDISSV
jgi:hypothetical protein